MSLPEMPLEGESDFLHIGIRYNKLKMSMFLFFMVQIDQTMKGFFYCVAKIYVPSGSSKDLQL